MLSGCRLRSLSGRGLLTGDEGCGDEFGDVELDEVDKERVGGGGGDEMLLLLVVVL